MSSAPLKIKNLARLNNGVHSIKFKARLDNSKRSLENNTNTNRPLVCSVCSSRRFAKPKLPIEENACKTETLYKKANHTLIIRSTR